MLMSLELSSLSRMGQIGLDPKVLPSLYFSPGLWFLVDFETLRAPLQELPFLTNLTLDQVPLYSETPRQPIAIELGCLRFLRFIIEPQRDCDEDVACSTLSLVRAPILSHYEINLSKRPVTFKKYSNYFRINPPAYPELHTLTLYQASDIAHSVASAFHNITSLQVIGRIGSVLDILESSDNGVYWEHLQELVLECPRIDIRKLTWVIQKRKKSGYPVSKVELDGAVECNGARQFDDWLHTQLGGMANSMLTCREVLEIYTSSLDAM
ncbi:hypothetical protein SERLA73DRAFT_73875 [Serpula lacrymans var. lacrymans S7.3]|uniref:Uncharacterized protein n=2 Tax=Serpula lacrymans var. lacrymans TaxID=341189 RepID=F8PX67_SERL3|nr:uncharacterized protein SERLADRAFT_438506 [Serpula lacrymans var. lacrymans S7.9]EGN99342.1 hypothetical protein SERLA73DRAFT_73875 [Serpula lacrymans var. lacrymans S7.3]EGO24906.1 hypothetical protein SERLADRAFT_438506 [Serpula lacrymans var. lacrymans S7.9]